MSVTAKNRVVFSIIAILAIVNLLVVPMISYGGGVFPKNSIDYFDVADAFFEKPGDMISSALFNTHLILTVPCLLLFITALTGSKGAQIGASIFGILAWFGCAVHCFAEGATFSNLFDFSDGCYAIGMYVALLLFIISLIVALASKSKKSQKLGYVQYPPQGYAPQNAYAPQGYGAPQNTYPPQPQGYPGAQQPYAPPAQAPNPYSAAPNDYYRQAAPQPAPQPQPAPAPQPAPQEPVVNDTPAQPEPEAPAAAAMFCPNCGAPVDGVSPFCGNCGTKL
ncbi:MAG: zinc-ribbon domain-containing protein [Clostridia bacterium]|nr:zinc-ribbon domain-containing protein [Clostridia bacterium]